MAQRQQIAEALRKAVPDTGIGTEVAAHVALDPVEELEVLQIVESEVMVRSAEVREELVGNREVRSVAPEREAGRLTSTSGDPDGGGDLPQLVPEPPVPTQLAVCDHVDDPSRKLP